MPKKVLIVDDNVYKVVEMIRALKDINVTEIDEAEDKESALALLEKKDYDLVLLDMFFPKKKGGGEEPWCGFQVLDWMQEHKKIIPVICTSSVRTNLLGYDFCIGQMVYRQDDTGFRIIELIRQIPYYFE